MDTPMMMGWLTAENLRGKEVFSFNYERKWLASAFCHKLDPDLALYEGRQFLYDEHKPNFGIFLDSCPDRWGRVLMQRREAAMARMEGRNAQRLMETDYLLGVYDQHRMGGVRFRLNDEGTFLSDDPTMAAPPWTSIGTLEQVSIKIEDDQYIDEPAYLQWISMLIAPGSSIGGARPKASVLDANGEPWIAKFPSKHDIRDIGAWEMLANRLAKIAGIQVAQGQAKRFSSQYHTFLSKRFDRERKVRRHFASAMTLLGKTDGASYQEGVSYLHLADFIMSEGSEPQQDLEELWRRMVFNICISNTDDHLRNHGFLLQNNGWKLSPAYDLNPNNEGFGLSLNISETDNALDIGLAISVAPYFRLTSSKANAIVREVMTAVAQWAILAKQLQIPRSEQEMMKGVFIR
jgi:serine/threonine-protein kinase HipA